MAEEAKKAAPEEVAKTGGGTIVVVAEDEAAISYMIKTELELAGYKVFAAKDGKEAVEMISKNHPKLILMDLNMPKMLGFEAIDTLKKNGYNLSGTKIIFLTSSSGHTDIEKAKSYGGDYMIKADLTPASLLSKIK